SDGIMMLGYCYDFGIGSSIDKQKAFELYQKAANLGNSVAQHNLANMYKNGEGVDKNKDQAIYWYKKSAEQGYQNAENALIKLQQEQQLEQQFSIMIDELINFHYKDLNEEKEEKIRNQHIFDYFNNQN